MPRLPPPGPVTRHLDAEGYEVTTGIGKRSDGRCACGRVRMIDLLCATRGMKPKTPTCCARSAATFASARSSTSRTGSCPSISAHRLCVTNGPCSASAGQGVLLMTLPRPLPDDFLSAFREGTGPSRWPRRPGRRSWWSVCPSIFFPQDALSCRRERIGKIDDRAFADAAAAKADARIAGGSATLDARTYWRFRKRACGRFAGARSG